MVNLGVVLIGDVSCNRAAARVYDVAAAASFPEGVRNGGPDAKRSYFFASDVDSGNSELGEQRPPPPPPPHSYLGASQTCPCSHHDTVRRIREQTRRIDSAKDQRSDPLVMERRGCDVERRRKNGFQATKMRDNWVARSTSDNERRQPVRSKSHPPIKFRSCCHDGDEDEDDDQDGRRSVKELLTASRVNQVQQLACNDLRLKGGDERLQPQFTSIPELPHCLREIILQHHWNNPASRSLESEEKSKLAKLISNHIWLPNDPEDPTAFTFTPGISRTTKKPWCRSKSVYKIVGSFALLMTVGIVTTVLYVSYASDTFRPMM